MTVSTNNTAFQLANALRSFGFNRYFGVPDSTIEALISSLEAGGAHISIAAHESQAVGEAVGYHLGTSRVPVVFLQNSGLGNIVNPCTSLASSSVFHVPMLFIIGWRSSPGTSDEPQHHLMGKATPRILDAINIPHWQLPIDSAAFDLMIKGNVLPVLERRQSCAILVAKGTFAEPGPSSIDESKWPLNRAETMRALLRGMSPATKSVVVATTGKTARELYHLRENGLLPDIHELRIVGSMGLASSVALGLAESRDDVSVVLMDGDGALLMHLGAIATIGSRAPKNLMHVCFMNGTHDSTGGQPLAAPHADFCQLAKAAGYSQVIECHTLDTIQQNCRQFFNMPGPCFVGIRIKPGSLPALGRPRESPNQNYLCIQRLLAEDRH